MISCQQTDEQGYRLLLDRIRRGLDDAQADCGELLAELAQDRRLDLARLASVLGHVRGALADSVDYLGIASRQLDRTTTAATRSNLDGTSAGGGRQEET